MPSENKIKQKQRDIYAKMHKHGHASLPCPFGDILEYLLTLEGV
jgi:hypothetical protein